MELQPENKTQKIARFALFVAVLVGIVAWQQGFFKDVLPAKSRSNASGPALSSADQALSDKLNPFTECMNRVDRNMRQNYDTYGKMYAQKISGEDKPLYFFGFTGFKIAPYEKNSEFSRECADKLAAAVKQSPADEVLDKEGTTYSETLIALIPVLTEVDSYYNQENYRDDQMKKGKELNEQLNPLFGKLFAASDKIHTAIDTHTLTLRNNELVAMEKENGKDFEWHTVNLAHQARLALDAINGLVEKDNLTVETLTPVETTYEKAFTEAKAYAAENPDTKTSLGNKPRWFSIDNNFENVLTSIRKLRRNLADQKDVEVINKDLERISDNYNSMIRTYNMHARLAR